MKFYNVNNPSEIVSLKEAVLKSISAENGLYMPCEIPLMSDDFFNNIQNLTLQEIVFEVSNVMLGDDIETTALRSIVNKALNFEIPINELDKDLFVMELFHGPTMAFKDVGARFMAGLFEYFLQKDEKEVTILVATSGDTGGAVANAFYKRDHVKVVILYPSGKVSNLQEKQLTTLGGNVTALEVKGNFDDCQSMVKQAFVDKELNQSMQLTSANSINFGRLFPQSFYYFFAYSKLKHIGKPLLISVPSGNFGNLTAGLLAKKMGLPIDKFVAATNENHVVPDFFETGLFNPSPTVHTISNAMDVGKPSNFSRMMALYSNDLDAIKHDVIGFWCDDETTKQSMKHLYEKYNYIADPHGAIAYWSLHEMHELEHVVSVFVETAHPAKFPEHVEQQIGRELPIPENLKPLLELEKKSILIDNDYKKLREFLMS